MTADPKAEQSLRLRFDDSIDEADACLMRAGQPVLPAPKPFAVLCALARTPRALVTKNALLDGVWGHRFVSESVLKSTISELRAAPADDLKQPRYIETVSRRGYRFIAAVGGPAASAVAALAATSAMIGRADALERLRAAWRLAAEGRRQIVWIAGEAGAERPRSSSASWPKSAKCIAPTGSASSSTAQASLICPSSSNRRLVPARCGLRRALSRSRSDLATAASLALRPWSNARACAES